MITIHKLSEELPYVCKCGEKKELYALMIDEIRIIKCDKCLDKLTKKVNRILS